MENHNKAGNPNFIDHIQSSISEKDVALEIGRLILELMKRDSIIAILKSELKKNQDVQESLANNEQSTHA